MSWETRQHRLRNLLNANNNLCFQVYIVVGRSLSDDASFEAAANQHGIEITDSISANIPAKNYREELQPKGWFRSNGTAKLAYIVETEALFTVCPYSISSSNPHTSNAMQDFKAICQKYIEAAAHSYEDLNFEGGYADWNGVDVSFHYIVRPYTLDMCGSNDFGILKPITILGERPIIPKIQKHSLIKALAQKP